MAAERSWVGNLKNFVIHPDVTKGSLMAGQSVGLVDKIMPLKKIIEEFVEDAETEMARLKEKLS